MLLIILKCIEEIFLFDMVIMLVLSQTFGSGKYFIRLYLEPDIFKLGLPVEVVLNHCSQDYWIYMYTLQLYNYGILNKLYSNVTGGVGIFAGYQSSSVCARVIVEQGFSEFR